MTQTMAASICGGSSCGNDVSYLDCHLTRFQLHQEYTRIFGVRVYKDFRHPLSFCQLTPDPMLRLCKFQIEELLFSDWLPSESICADCDSDCRVHICDCCEIHFSLLFLKLWFWKRITKICDVFVSKCLI